jgi:hypothetical protein
MPMTDTTTTTTETDLTTRIDAYVASLNEQNLTERQARIEEAWVPEGSMTDPLVSLKGYEELASFAPLLAEHYPGHRIRRTGDVDAHHNLFRFSWDLVDADGETVMAGIDVGIVADDGRISAIGGFFDQ